MPPTRRAALLGLAALRLASPARARAPLDVVATIGLIADAAHVPGDGGVAVGALMAPGVDPYACRQTRSDTAAMVGADLMPWNGPYVEARMDGFTAALAARKPVVGLADALPRERLLAHDAHPDRLDPHVWMDPTLRSGVAEAIAAALPDAGAPASPFREALAALHAGSAEVPASVPAIDVALMRLHRELGLLGRPKPRHRTRAEPALTRAGTLDLARRRSGRLSGGQRQRVFLARALDQDAPLILLDEPLAGVDAATDAVGAIIVVAMLVCPPAAARPPTDRLWAQVALSAAIAALPAALG